MPTGSGLFVGETARTFLMSPRDPSWFYLSRFVMVEFAVSDRL